jgi:SAM-dependent methyltransferase
MLLRILRRIHRRAFAPKTTLDPFDLRHGVDTSGLIDARGLESGHPHDRHSASYWGTAPSLFQGSIARWIESLSDSPYPLSDFTLIDVGCGKGRVLMLASDLPFRAIVGVELSLSLASIAQTNLAKWNRSPHICKNVSVLNADALAIPVPDSPMLVYLFNPFDAHVTQLLLDRLQALAAKRSSPIDFIYTRPEHAQLFAQVPDMQLLWDGDIPFSAEDIAADVFHGTAQRCAIYRLPAASLPS